MKSTRKTQADRVLGTTSAVLVLSLALVTWSGADKTRTPDITEIRNGMVRRLEDRVLHYTNEARKVNGLPPLEASEGLTALARSHSVNMCRTRTFAHESTAFPKGWHTLAERLKHAGVRSGGENIGYQTIITKDAEAWSRRMVDGWMKGPAHRKNILNPQFRYMGVGVRPCRNDLGYATQVFSPEPGRAP